MSLKKYKNQTVNWIDLTDEEKIEVVKQYRHESNYADAVTVTIHSTIEAIDEQIDDLVPFDVNIVKDTESEELLLSICGEYSGPMPSIEFMKDFRAKHLPIVLPTTTTTITFL